MNRLLVMVLVGVASTMAACAEVSEPTSPPMPTVPPTVRPEPTPLPDDAGHPVVVHDCDTEAGYSTTGWQPDPPPDGESEAHLLAVYQARGDHSFGFHPVGAADVYVHRVSRSLVLMFSSYEPVLWRVHADAEVRIERVVLYGYHAQQVSGVPEGVPVVDKSGVDQPRPDQTAISPPDYVTTDAGAPVGSVTGCYDAALFTVR